MNNENSEILGRYYVYALIDPRTNIPFYIGKGEGNRAANHFQSIVGLSPDEVISQFESSESKINHKIERLKELKGLGYEPKDIVRVICRRVNEDVAFAIESSLIMSIYGRGPGKLSNIQGGHLSERFRPVGNFDYIPSFDCPVDQNHCFISNENHMHGDFYVYVLLNPKNSSIFYVGKGTKNRLSQHFIHAKKHVGSDRSNEKLSEISELINQGFKESDIGRIVAIVDTEDMAFMLETLYIKFIVGYVQLTNIQPGQYAGLFRSKDDWQLRTGFDIPLIVRPGQARTEIRDLFLSAGLDGALYKVKEKLCEDSDYKDIIFSDPQVQGAGELCIDSLVDDSITLRLQIRHALKYQISLKATNRRQKEWIVDHFHKLESFPYKRKDFWFIPINWRGWGNVTPDINIAADRLKMMIKLIRANSREDLPKSLSEELLGGLPFTREVTTYEDNIIKSL